jgi:hypothetical protein
VRIERTTNTIDIYVAKEALKSSAVSATSVLLLWVIGGAKVTAAIVIAVALLVSPLLLLDRRPRKARPSLARPITPATH